MVGKVIKSNHKVGCFSQNNDKITPDLGNFNIVVLIQTK